jgi:hypothetical protein
MKFSSLAIDSCVNGAFVMHLDLKKGKEKLHQQFKPLFQHFKIAERNDWFIPSPSQSCMNPYAIYYLNKNSHT